MSILSEQSIARPDADRSAGQALGQASSAALTPQPPGELAEAQLSDPQHQTQTHQTEPSLTGESAPNQPQQLQQLWQHPAIYSGDLTTALPIVTKAAATLLNVDRASVWLFENSEHALAVQNQASVRLRQIDSYEPNGPAYGGKLNGGKAGDNEANDCEANDCEANDCEANDYGADGPASSSDTGNLAHGQGSLASSATNCGAKDLDSKGHTQGLTVAIADCGPYIQALESLGGHSLANVLEATASAQCLAQQGLIYTGPGALLDVPIRHQGKIVGVLWCEHRHEHAWTAIEKTTAMSLALLAADAITTNKQQALNETIFHQRQQLRREIIEREQAEQAWQESQRFIQGIIDASTNILYVDSFKDGSNVYISRWIKNVLGYDPYEMQKLGPCYLEQLVHSDEKMLMASERRKLADIHDGEVVENEYRFRHRQGNWRWLLCRETVFQRDEDGQPKQVFGTATDITKRKHAEVALQEFNEELERLARMDGLTQVANRRSFDEYLAQEWKNVGTGRSSLSLILCDIDYFKSFNDTYGHQAGDVCLRQVAQAIERAVKRSSDLVARYGGEEFGVILPNTNVAGVARVAVEIQKEIRQLAIPHAESAISPFVTVSLGIAAVTTTEETHPDMLIAAADQGLYQAKYEGRDRFCICDVDQLA